MFVVVRVCLCLLAATVATAINNNVFKHYADLQEDFKVFKEKYEKDYMDETEEELRMKIFANNKYEIDQHNERYKQGLETYTMGVNKFGDLLHHEFMLSHSLPNNTRKLRKPDHQLDFLKREGYSPVDWRQKNAVTPVRDYWDCGSSHIIAAVESLEAQHAFSNKLIVLSVQEIIDCSVYEDTEDCRFSVAEYVYRHIRDSGGIQAEDACSYNNNTNSCCESDLVRAKCLLFHVLPPSDEELLDCVLYGLGPVAVRIDSSKLQFYQSGIFFDETCSNAYEDLDIAVLVVGLNATENGVPYYIVKNSWGEDWGEEGYVRMARRRNNHCGIATAGTIPHTSGMYFHDYHRLKLVARNVTLGAHRHSSKICMDKNSCRNKYIPPLYNDDEYIV